jgi:hypothetical protein
MTVVADVEACCATDGKCDPAMQRVKYRAKWVRFMTGSLSSDSGLDRNELDYPKNGGHYTPDFSFTSLDFRVA